MMMMMTTTTTLLLSALGVQDIEQSRSSPELMNKIRSMMIDLNYQDAPFDEVISFIREFSGINFFVAPAAYEKGGRDSMKVNIKVKGVRLITALKLVLNQFDLAAVVKEGLVEITTKEKLSFNVSLRVYDVRDLFIKINNFPGPRLELIAPTGAGGVGGAGGGGGAVGVTFMLEEPQESRINQDFLTELIRELCEPKSWENPNASIAMSPTGMMLVTQSKSAHGEIEKLIGMIREIR